MAPGEREYAVQAALYDHEGLSTDGAPIILPAYSYRSGIADGEWGVRLSGTGNVQLDGKGSATAGRFAGSFGFGMGTDIGSLAVLLLTADGDDSDEDDDPGLLTLDVFAPAIGSFEVIPQYLSLHATLRPQLWVFTPSQGDDTGLGRHVRFYAVPTAGCRVGKHFGVHVEAAPVWSTARGWGWTAAASLFVRLPGDPTNENGDE